MASLSGMSGGFDSLPFEVLEDGTISIKTDRISGTNHVSADELLAELAEVLGGEYKVAKRLDVKVPLHHHHHQHDHQHGHGHDHLHQ